LVSQIRRAAVSVCLNVAEGCSRSSCAERKRYFEIARGSLIELDTALDISIHIGFLSLSDPEYSQLNVVDCYKLLSSLINQLKTG
jgi:four helix bundle protein